MPASSDPATALPSLQDLVATGVTTRGTETVTLAVLVTKVALSAVKVPVLPNTVPSVTGLSAGTRTPSTTLIGEPSGSPTEPGGFGASNSMMNRRSTSGWRRCSRRSAGCCWPAGR